MPFLGLLVPLRLPAFWDLLYVWKDAYLIDIGRWSPLHAPFEMLVSLILDCHVGYLSAIQDAGPPGFLPSETPVLRFGIQDASVANIGCLSPFAIQDDGLADLGCLSPFC